MVDYTSSSVHQHNTFDASGTRVDRKSTQSETIFSSQYFDLENGTQGVKHVFAGGQRVASELTKFQSGANPTAPSKQGTAYFFHQDHLASTHVVTDDTGGIQESLEYFADGELWIDRGPQKPVTGYLFSGKPFDPDTGFYDFGQRFYEPRTSLWLGVDALGKQNIAGAIAHPAALAPLAFTAHNPLRYVDRDGRQPLNNDDPFGLGHPEFNGPPPLVCGTAEALALDYELPVIAAGATATVGASIATGGLLGGIAANVAGALGAGPTTQAIVGGLVAGVSGTATADVITGHRSSTTTYIISGGIGIGFEVAALGFSAVFRGARPSVVPEGPTYPEGAFSIWDWSGYPSHPNVPQPAGPFRLLEGDEYEAARDAADAANRRIHRAQPELAGQDIHEPHPVKFGGDPVGSGNKTPLPRSEHTPFTTWWNRLQREITRPRPRPSSTPDPWENPLVVPGTEEPPDY
jgi:RHS repeat-associated protein